jgi:hypothetical protein
MLSLLAACVPAFAVPLLHVPLSLQPMLLCHCHWPHAQLWLVLQDRRLMLPTSGWCCHCLGSLCACRCHHEASAQKQLTHPLCLVCCMPPDCCWILTHPRY